MHCLIDYSCVLICSHPSVVVKTPPLQVLLLDSSNEGEEEDVCVNMDLIRLEVARLCATGNSSQQESSNDHQTGIYM
jgi:hypothetical protein